MWIWFKLGLCTHKTRVILRIRNHPRLRVLIALTHHLFFQTLLTHDQPILQRQATPHRSRPSCCGHQWGPSALVRLCFATSPSDQMLPGWVKSWYPGEHPKQRLLIQAVKSDLGAYPFSQDMLVLNHALNLDNLPDTPCMICSLYPPHTGAWVANQYQSSTQSFKMLWHTVLEGISGEPIS